MCYMANPGSMLGMCVKGSRLRLSEVEAGSMRKFKYSVEAIRIGETWIGCNTGIANRIVSTMLAQRCLSSFPTLSTHTSFRAEVKLDDSRVDFVLESAEPGCLLYLEVKTVTMASDWYDVESSTERADKPFHRFPTERPTECDIGSGPAMKTALFPDCQSDRARKHAMQLGAIARAGKHKSAIVYVVMRDDVSSVSPSAYCDPQYAEAIRLGLADGLNCVGLMCRLLMDDVADCSIQYIGPIPVSHPPQAWVASPRVTQSPSRKKRVRTS